MATFNTDIYLEQKETRANPSRLATANVASGDVQFAEFKYIIAGTEDSNDIINLILLPSGAIPIPQLSRIFVGASPAADLTIDIGNADNPDGFGDGFDLSAGGLFPFTAGTAPAWLVQTPLVADGSGGTSLIYVTITSASTPVVGVTLFFQIAWKIGR